MKKLLLLMLTAVAAVACEKEKPEEMINKQVVSMQFDVSVEKPSGETLFASTGKSGIATDNVRLRYLSTNNTFERYAAPQHGLIAADRPFGVEFVSEGSLDKPLMIIEVITPTGDFFDVPYGYSTATNYIDWADTTPGGASDKVEAKIHRYGSIIEICELKINDQFVWKRTKEMPYSGPMLKKVIDGDNSYYQDISMKY